jgi:hypothetical protein
MFCLIKTYKYITNVVQKKQLKWHLKELVRLLGWKFGG